MKKPMVPAMPKAAVHAPAKPHLRARKLSTMGKSAFPQAAQAFPPPPMAAPDPTAAAGMPPMPMAPDAGPVQ